jgi:serine/threonine protein kinase
VNSGPLKIVNSPGSPEFSGENVGSVAIEPLVSKAAENPPDKRYPWVQYATRRTNRPSLEDIEKHGKSTGIVAEGSSSVIHGGTLPGGEYPFTKYVKKELKQNFGDEHIKREVELNEQLENGIQKSLKEALDGKESEIFNVLGSECLPTFFGGKDRNLYLEKAGVAPMCDFIDCKNYFKNFSNDQRLRFAAQMLAGLHVLHRNGIVHRDLKCENMMVGDDGKLRVIDIGFGERIGGDVGNRGLLPYCSSYEEYQGRYRYPNKSLGQLTHPATDMYGAGIVLLSILFGQHGNITGNQIFKPALLNRQDYKINIEARDKFTSGVSKMVQSLNAELPKSSRFTKKQLVFLERLIEAFTAKNPTKRLTAAQGACLLELLVAGYTDFDEALRLAMELRPTPPGYFQPEVLKSYVDLDVLSRSAKKN